MIPARAGSVRMPDKNVRRLAGHPLLAYSIAAARESGVFDKIVVSTDSPHYADIARHYGAEVQGIRPAAMAGELAPDIEWVTHMLGCLTDAGHRFDCFSILRPTSPFRTAETIRRAWGEFVAAPGCDSLRAVEKCKQHPGKMWVIRGRWMTPIIPLTPGRAPWHSSAYQSLPEVYVQNASLEIAWTRVPLERGTIAGDVVLPFLTRLHEGRDINSPEDWRAVELLVDEGGAELPQILVSPWPG